MWIFSGEIESFYLQIPTYPNKRYSLFAVKTHGSGNARRVVPRQGDGHEPKSKGLYITVLGGSSQLVSG